MKPETLSKLAQFLKNLQDRITKTAEKTAKLAETVESNRVQAFQRSEQIAKTVAAQANHITIVKQENDRRETAQVLRDQNNVQSIVNLKESTQKAFDQVKTDVQTLMNADARLRERLTAVETLQQDLLERAKKVIVEVNRYQTTPVLPVGHEWVNKKLTGVYDSVEDLEARIEKVEKLIALYEGLRKAQIAFAEANGAFLAGPKEDSTSSVVKIQRNANFTSYDKTVRVYRQA